MLSSPHSIQIALLFNLRTFCLSKRSFVLEASSAKIFSLSSWVRKPPSSLFWRSFKSCWIWMMCWSSCNFLFISHSLRIFFIIVRFWVKLMASPVPFLTWYGIQCELISCTTYSCLSHAEQSLKGLASFFGCFLISRQMGRWSQFTPQSTHWLNMRSVSNSSSDIKNLSSLLAILSSPRHLLDQVSFRGCGSTLINLESISRLLK